MCFIVLYYIILKLGFCVSAQQISGEHPFFSLFPIALGILKPENSYDLSVLIFLQWDFKEAIASTPRHNTDVPVMTYQQKECLLPLPYSLSNLVPLNTFDSAIAVVLGGGIEAGGVAVPWAAGAGRAEAKVPLAPGGPVP